LAHPRIGIVVPKRGRTTVDRNRLKRRLRELVRVELLTEIAPMDVVVRTRDEAYGASFADLRAQVLYVGKRLGRGLQQGGQ
jgi:ribonuclease P protein component